MVATLLAWVGPGGAIERAWADSAGHVVKPEAIVKAAPFEVAPNVAVLHAGEVVTALEQPRPGWRRIRLADGRFGVIHEDDLAVEQGVEPPRPTILSPSAKAPASTPPAPRPLVTMVSATFELLPFGSIHTETLSSTGQKVALDNDAATAWALGLGFDGRVLPHLEIGLAPRMVFHLRDARASVGAAERELDVRVRITGREELSPELSVFARTAGGYSRLFLPSSADDPDSPAGLVWDIAAGLNRRIAPQIDLVVELGYQFGFQRVDARSSDVHSLDAAYSSLHLGIGLSRQSSL